jgi:hypothetical protein
MRTACPISVSLKKAWFRAIAPVSSLAPKIVTD